jgi:hypothetical protein
VLTLGLGRRYAARMFRRRLYPWLGTVTLGLVLLGSASCGDVNVRDGMTAGYETCQSHDNQFHFKVLIPPWKYNKEYRCSQWTDGTCTGVWTATGRYVWVVSDVPFVNYDSEIIASMDVAYEAGSTVSLVYTLIATEDIGVPGSNATFIGEPADYPREILADPDGGLAGHELIWRQNRSFDGALFNWYRRDVFLSGAGGRVYHLKFFSIEALDKPEFDKILSTFREGAAEDGGASCPCTDEHDPDALNNEC